MSPRIYGLVAGRTRLDPEAHPHPEGPRGDDGSRGRRRAVRRRGTGDSGPSPMTITARFATAPGLYPGNSVDVLGMPVGSVTKVTPGPTYVTVAMQVPAGTPIPARADALIMAPQVVNDRYVQLNPGYSGGPRMRDNAVIPLSRTAVPISVDEIVDNLDRLAKALGPNGANAHGALSTFVAESAHAFGGNGAALHSTLTSLGSALDALSSKSPQLTALFDNLGNLSQVASQYTGTYQAFANNLAAVSTDLASDDSEIGATLANLQQALGALAQFTANQLVRPGQQRHQSRRLRRRPSPPSSRTWPRPSRRCPIALGNISAGRRSERSRRSGTEGPPRPDGRLGRLLPVGLRQLPAAPPAPLHRPDPGQDPDDRPRTAG